MLGNYPSVGSAHELLAPNRMIVVSVAAPDVVSLSTRRREPNGQPWKQEPGATFARLEDGASFEFEIGVDSPPSGPMVGLLLEVATNWVAEYDGDKMRVLGGDPFLLNTAQGAIFKPPGYVAGISPATSVKCTFRNVSANSAVLEVSGLKNKSTYTLSTNGTPGVALALWLSEGNTGYVSFSNWPSAPPAQSPIML